MTAQKTWIDLLGPSAENCAVDGRRVIRRNSNRCVVLYTSVSNIEARAVMSWWEAELAVKAREGDYVPLP